MRALQVLVGGVVLGLTLGAHASFINYSSREINVKIVYYGPATAGLSENLRYIYGKTNPEAKGKLIELATETDRTLFFDFLPLSLGEIRGFKTRFHLYTVPGQVLYEASRKLILKGVDGVVFVADADPKQAEANLASWRSLVSNLAEQGYDWKKMPLIVQVDTRRYTGKVFAEAVTKDFGLEGHQVFLADPTTGAGVFDSLKAIAKLVLLELKKGATAPPAAGASPDAAVTARPATVLPQLRQRRHGCGIYALGEGGACKVDKAVAVAAIRSSSLSRHVDVIGRDVQPTVWMQVRKGATAKPTLGESRFGGLPDVPAGFAWPKRNGAPLELVAQLRLSDLSAAPGMSPLPRSGWLSAFCPLSDPDWFAEPKDGSCKVVYFDVPLAKLRTTKPAGRKETSFERARLPLILRHGLTLRDPFSSGLQLTAGEPDAHAELEEQISNRGDDAFHQVLGHPRPIQDDPRLECLAAFEPGSLADPKTRATALEKWTLLIQLDSDERVDWTFGDVGSLYFLIRKTDLAARRFDDVCAVAQGH